MSKLQKALHRIREDSKETNRHGSRHQDTKWSPVSEPVAEQRSDTSNAPGGGVRKYRIPEFAAEAEPQATYSIEVTPESLIEHGLLPADADLKLIAQQFRRIKRPVLNTAFAVDLCERENANVIMVASALPKTGKTFCSFNLAKSIARERDVGAVLVDADVLKPNISCAFGLEGRLGLIDYLLSPSVTMEDILVATNVHGVIAIPAGREHEDSTELLASRRMQEFVNALSKLFMKRAIVVDTPPLLLTNEAHVLAEHMGQIVLVIEAGVSAQQSVTQALESLNRDMPINAILNKARGGTYGNYGDGNYGYYSVPRREDA